MRLLTERPVTGDHIREIYMLKIQAASSLALID